mgnify:CR=1 FL=1
MAAFLRGFVDSEGCINKSGYICIINTNVELLNYVKELLKRHNIESTGPKLTSTRRGTIIHNPRTGKRYVTKKDCYHIYIRASSNTNFYKHVGFTVRRKQIRLENYINRANRRPKPLPHHFPNQHHQTHHLTKSNAAAGI